MVAFLVGVGLGALIVFLLSWDAHYSLLEDNRDLRREVGEFREQELNQVLARVAVMSLEAHTDVPVNVKVN